MTVHPTIAAGLLLALWLGACADPSTAPQGRGTSPTVSPAGTATASPAATITTPASSSPRPTATVTGSQTLTEEDAGATVVLKTGETVRVVLGADYHQPAAQGDAVQRTGAAGGYPTGSPATATFRAVRPGTAVISSSTDYACLHATPSCALPQQLWSVEIRVV